MATKKEQMIQDLALFGGCGPADVRWIAQHADEVDVSAGRRLADEGAAVREFVVVIDGVFSSSDGNGEVLLGRGSYYGDRGLLSDSAHHATVESRTRSRVLVFGVPAFRGLINRLPALHDKLLSDLSARAGKNDQDESLSLRAVS